ncbi:hypothetical protein J2W15_001778 [Pseudarthrobacter sulfonivorans]|nr:hypothetical protein [Pseudarthrobacter sulfonivorans]
MLQSRAIRPRLRRLWHVDAPGGGRSWSSQSKSASGAAKRSRLKRCGIRCHLEARRHQRVMRAERRIPASGGAITTTNHITAPSSRRTTGPSALTTAASLPFRKWRPMTGLCLRLRASPAIKSSPPGTSAADSRRAPLAGIARATTQRRGGAWVVRCGCRKVSFIAQELTESSGRSGASPARMPTLTGLLSRSYWHSKGRILQNAVPAAGAVSD